MRRILPALLALLAAATPASRGETPPPQAADEAPDGTEAKPMAAQEIVEKYRKRFGDECRYVADQDYRLAVVSDLDEAETEKMLKILRLTADAHWKHLFSAKPPYCVAVLLLRPGSPILKKAGLDPRTAGFYRPEKRTLIVSMATGGGTAVHEYTHALHIADMEAAGQVHPIWLIEGLGALYEGCRWDDGAIYGCINWRLPILLQMIEKGSCPPLAGFLADSKAFFDKDPNAGYAVARQLCYYLQEKGLLDRFYAAYRKGYGEDPTGAKALEAVCGKPLAGIEKDWKAHIAQMDSRMGDGEPYTGFSFKGDADGLEVTKVDPDGPAAKAGLRVGDLVLRIDGAKVKSYIAWLSILVRNGPGEEIALSIQRDGKPIEARITLSKRAKRPQAKDHEQKKEGR